MVATVIAYPVDYCVQVSWTGSNYEQCELYQTQIIFNGYAQRNTPHGHGVEKVHSECRIDSESYDLTGAIISTVRPLLSGPPFIRISLLSGLDLAVIFFCVCTIITGKRGISNSIRIPTQTHMNYILFPT